MDEWDDTKLRQLLKQGTQAVPGRDFVQNTMQRIAQIEQVRGGRVTDIRAKLRRYGNYAAGVAAAVVLTVTGVWMWGSPQQASRDIAFGDLDIDDIVVQEAALSLDATDDTVMDALCAFAISESGDLPVDSVQDFLW